MIHIQKYIIFRCSLYVLNSWLQQKDCNIQHHSDISSSHNSAVYYSCVNRSMYFCNGTLREPNLSRSQKEPLHRKETAKLKHSTWIWPKCNPTFYKRKKKKKSPQNFCLLSFKEIKPDYFFFQGIFLAHGVFLFWMVWAKSKCLLIMIWECWCLRKIFSRK